MLRPSADFRRRTFTSFYSSIAIRGVKKSVWFMGKRLTDEHSPLFTHLQAAFTPHCCSMNKHLFLLIYSLPPFQHPPYASILPDNISNPITPYFFPKISKLQHTQNLKYHIFTYLSTAATQASISDSKGIPLQFYRT